MHQFECDWTFAEIIAQDASMIEVLTQLRQEVGQTMVTMLSGTKDRADLHRWLSGELVPRKAEAKLRFALTAWIFICADKGPSTARRVLASVNAMTHKSVVVDIREGNFAQVRAHLTCAALKDFA